MLAATQRNTGRFIAYPPAVQQFYDKNHKNITQFITSIVKTFKGAPQESSDAKVKSSLLEKFQELKNPQFEQVVDDIVSSAMLYINQKT